MKRCIFLGLALLFSSFAFAQSADVITEILDSKEGTFGQVCYISAVQQGFIKDSASYDEAIASLQKKGQLPDSVVSTDSIPAVDAVYIFTKIWDIKGGLMYRITKGSPRYAFRQFQSDGIIDSTLEPNNLISGEKLLQIYTSCSSKYGSYDLSKVSMEEE